MKKAIKQPNKHKKPHRSIRSKEKGNIPSRAFKFGNMHGTPTLNWDVLLKQNTMYLKNEA